MEALRHVVTDIDGTVVDRMPIYTTIFCHLVSRFRVNLETAARLYADSAGATIQSQFRNVVLTRGRELSDYEVDELVREFFEEAHKIEAPLFPGAREVLCVIKDMGLSLCATSGSTTADLNKIFAREGLEYDVVLGSDEIKKGDAHIILFAQHFGVTIPEFAKRAIYIGDGPTDMEIARRNGLVAVGIITTVSREKLVAAGAEHVIGDLSEFVPLLRSLLKV